MNDAPNLSQLRVNEERLRLDFEALSQIGSTGDGGVHRPALSEAHLEARKWFAGRVQADGLDFHMDGAGNHSAVLECSSVDAPVLLLGSHLDSVPSGGRFDGALGVLAALECLRVVKEAAVTLPVNLEAIDFTDEEGTLVGLLGSSALAGKLTTAELQAPRGGREALLAGLERAGLSEEGVLTARRSPGQVAGYLEVHIEQGARLERAGASIGIVSAIVGICSYQLTFTGRADHAGTTPMTERADAGLGAAAFTLAARQLLVESFPGCTANLGQVRFSPGAFNIVPAQAVLSLEFRASQAATLQRMESDLLGLARFTGERYALKVDAEPLGCHEPAPLSQTIQQAIAAAAQNLGLKALPLVSGAGHDAQSLVELCPAGMFFIPSAAGASHSAREFSEWQDCVNGANVLLQAALLLAGSQVQKDTEIGRQRDAETGDTERRDAGAG